jgi:hypothetical protein
MPIQKSSLSVSLQREIDSALGSLGLMGSPRPAGVSIGQETYYVNKNGGSDNFDGKSPDQAFATVQHANEIMAGRIDWSPASGIPWANSDICYIYPGKYAETMTSYRPHGCFMIGLGNSMDHDGETGVVINPATGGAWVGSLVNAIVANVYFQTTAGQTADILTGASFNNTQWFSCEFAEASAASISGDAAFTWTTGVNSSRWIDCVFRNAAFGMQAQTASMTYSFVDHCRIMDITDAGIYMDTSQLGTGTLFNDVQILQGQQTLALGIDDNADVFEFTNCMIEATACDPASGAGKYNSCYLNGALIT